MQDKKNTILTELDQIDCFVIWAKGVIVVFSTIQELYLCDWKQTNMAAK